MKGFGYKEKVEIDKHRFQVHTGCDPDKHRIVTEVFEEGLYLYGKKQGYSLRKQEHETPSEVYLKSIVSDLHQATLDELEVIFRAHEKLKEKNDFLSHYRLGKVFLSKNFYTEAIENFERAIEIRSEYIRAYKLLGLTFLKAGAHDRAIKTYQSALELQPDFPDLINGLGIIHTHIGNYEQARNFFQQALKINPDFIESYFNLGVILFLATLSENPNEEIVIPVRIIRTLKELKQLESYQGTYWQQLFDDTFLVLEQKNKESIVHSLKELQLRLASKEDDIVTAMDFFFIKFMYGGKGLKDEEMAYYEQKIRQEADKHEGYADYWNELGTLHLIQCRDYFLRAMNEIGEAVKLNPKYEEANHSLELMKNSKKGFLILLRAILK